MTEPALSYQDVSKDYVRSHLGKTTVTRGVAGLGLSVGRGEILGLLGLNGSGKTTTLKLALGLLRPTRGRVRVFGLDPGSIESRGRVGYLPELPYFPPYHTPAETLRLYGLLSGLRAAGLESRVAAVLGRVGLGPAAGRRIGEFSKGMLQRVGMAQCLLHDPDLLLLDEPVSGLDPLAVADFRGLLAALNKEGKSVLVSSHSISEVERLCGRAAILVEGRLARVVNHAEWGGAASLEDLFVAMVRPPARDMRPGTAGAEGADAA